MLSIRQEFTEPEEIYELVSFEFQSLKAATKKYNHHLNKYLGHQDTICLQDGVS